MNSAAEKPQLRGRQAKDSLHFGNSHFLLNLIDRFAVWNCGFAD
jgi:hypothetical protein